MTLTIAEIITATAHEFGVTARDITGPSRQDVFTRPRFAVCAIAHDAGFSYPQIGRKIGNRDHATIMNAARRAIEIASIESAFCESLSSLRDTLLRNPAKADQWQFTSIRSQK